MRVELHVHGRGRGHANRALIIHEVVREMGMAPVIFAGGDALDLLRPLADGGTEVIEEAPVLPGPRALHDLLGATRRQTLRMMRARPDLVISDGVQAAVLAAKATRTTSIAVGHDLAFTACRPAHGRLPEASLRQQRVNGWIPTHLATHRIAVNFVPVVPTKARTRVACPDLAEELAGATRDDDFVLCYFRDPNALHVLDALLSLGREVRCFGRGFSHPKLQVEPVAREAFAEALRSCSAVIGSAGSNLISETLAIGKPILALHGERDHEQRLNAAMLTESATAMGMPMERVGIEHIKRFLAEVKPGHHQPIALPPLSTTLRALLEEISLAR